MTVLNYRQACARHEALEKIHKLWAHDYDISMAVQGAWGAATATSDNGTAMACAVRTALPIDYVPLFRAYDGVPTVYLLSCLSQVMQAAQVTKPILADTFQCAQLLQLAFQEFEARRKLADDIEEGFGCDRSVAWAVLRKCDDMSNNPEIQKQMQAIAKLAGRIFQQFAHTGIPHPSPSPEEVQGVETGDEVQRLLSTEAALMQVPGANADALARLDDRQLAQTKLGGTTPHTRGPLVEAIDESGSMHDYFNSHRNIWSKACSVALARIALAEGRRVRVVHFSTSTYAHDVDFNDPSSIKELMFSHIGGGTDIGRAMRCAVDQCDDLEQHGEKGADIVFITDGLDRYGDGPFLEMKNRGVKLWTISIDVDLKNHHQYNTQPFLHSFAAAYLHIDDATIKSGARVEALMEFKNAAIDRQDEQADA